MGKHQILRTRSYCEWRNQSKSWPLHQRYNAIIQFWPECT